VPSSFLGLKIKSDGGIGLDTIWIYPNHLSCIIGMSIIGNLRTQHVTGKNILDQQKTKTSVTIVSRNDELSSTMS
jgi:hypothetical protein